MTFIRPANALGGELVLWREDGTTHTLVTICGPLFAPQLGVEVIDLTCALHDADGSFVTSWRHELRADGTVFIDSRERATHDPLTVRTGALVVWVSPAPSASPSATSPRPSMYVRAHAMVDWFSDGGELCSLHADQAVVVDRDRPSSELELTEIVFEETETRRTSLVIVNGPEMQPASTGLRLVLRNHRGDERAIEYPSEMAPFSVHEIALGQLTENLVAFCDGEDATIEGRFTAHGIFTRPYVMTKGEIAAAYHGGTRLRTRAIPRLVHRALPYSEATELASMPREMMRVAAQKEMNPGYAVHDPSTDLTTRVHLFQSHGDLDEDFAVDAVLYDATGRVISQRERCGLAPRRGVTTLNVAEMVGDAPFEGHIALRFSEDPHEAFPLHVQALMEYRTKVSVARVMLWSDRWNALDRLCSHDHPYRALYRVFISGPRISRLAITNPGLSGDYDREASYAVRLRSAAGDRELVFRGTLGPHATTIASMDDLFPTRFAGELATVIVESPFDLASIHLTEDTRSGVVAVEHLHAVIDRAEDGTLIAPCGS